ncbi:hypothetical protein DPMN_036188 [Dreissena polymorpha]|uniref:Uncharacterized protein n=1 Tax=Dreissena polymorpha TaxID=45954 RepID=A0A9D4MC37_DREPO|nr:hypothetical protein DPMN_036188 [Dreissena polymorpha]
MSNCRGRTGASKRTSRDSWTRNRTNSPHTKTAKTWIEKNFFDSSPNLKRNCSELKRRLRLDL